MTITAPLTFHELVERLKQFQLEELRKDYEGYFEFVITIQHLGYLYPILERFYGVPFKPAGIEPETKHNHIANRYGGVLTQQTLYYIEKGGMSNCAMIWPWNDGSRATVKMARGVIGETKA